MKVYFLRHGEADWPNWDRPDEERPLTKKGKKQMRKVAKKFEEYEVAPNAILTSPLPRAAETAEIAAEALGLDTIQEQDLAPGFDQKKLAVLLSKYAGRDIMLVGHEPDFSGVIGALTGARLKLAKAGLALVDVPDPAKTDGVLLWLVPPKILKG